MKAQRYFFSVLFLFFPAIIFYKYVKTFDQEVLTKRECSPLHHSLVANVSRRATTFKLPTVKTKVKAQPEMTSGKEEIRQIKKLFVSPTRNKFNCTKLFFGDINEIKRVKAYNKKIPYYHLPEETFVNATNHCPAYISARGYITSVSKEERAFPLAYSITIHKNADQFERLLRIIYRPNNFYCVHIDRKSDKRFQEAVKAVTDCFDNVFIPIRSEIVVYAGFTRLQADINCMTELYYKYRGWKYVLNMAGTELPLKTNLELVQILKVYNGMNIVGKNNRTLPGRWKKRYATKIANMSGHISVQSKTNEKPPFNLKMVKGSAYAIFSRAMIGYILVDPVPIKFLEWCKTTYSPDEHFWSTLNDLEANPHLETPGGNASPGTIFITRAVLWASSKCRGKNVRHICEYGVGNLQWLQQAHEFVANKFDFSTDHAAFECMEQLLSERFKQKRPWDLDYHRAFVDAHWPEPQYSTTTSSVGSISSNLKNSTRTETIRNNS